MREEGGKIYLIRKRINSGSTHYILRSKTLLISSTTSLRWKVKGNFAPVFKHHDMKVCGIMVVKLHMFLELATDGRHIYAPATLLPGKGPSVLTGQEDGWVPRSV
jgi:hypothetical protein